jgi:hypothetical protein
MSTTHSIQVKPQDAQGLCRIVPARPSASSAARSQAKIIAVVSAGFMKASWRALLKQKDYGRIRMAGSIVPPRD